MQAPAAPRNNEYTQFAVGGNMTLSSAHKENVLHRVVGITSAYADLLGSAIRHPSESSPYNTDFTRGQLARSYKHAGAMAMLEVDCAIAEARPPRELVRVLRNAFDEDNRETMSWPGWLTTSPRKGGATDDQFHAVLRWNLQAMVAQNTSETPRIEGLRQTYLAKTQTAVANGTLSPRFADEAEQRVSQTKIIVQDPLALYPTTSVAFRGANVVRLAKGYTDFGATHEATHIVGNIPGIADEPLTNMLSRVIAEEDRSTPDSISCYTYAEVALGSLLQQAEIGTYEISDIYAHPSYVHRKSALGKLHQERTGDNSLIRTMANLRRNVRQAGKHTGNAWTYAGLKALHSTLYPTLSVREVLDAASPSNVTDKHKHELMDGYTALERLGALR